MNYYKCEICGHDYFKEKEFIDFEKLPDNYKCPICGSGKDLYSKVILGESKKQEQGLKYKETTKKSKSATENNMGIIQSMSVYGVSPDESMRTSKNLPSWDDILVLGAQLSKFPLMEEEDVNIKTVIGKNAKKPLETEMPVFVSHMSYGALSKEVKTAMAKGSYMAKTAIGSGEGGILPEEKNNAYKYIFEYVPNLYSVTKENLKNSDAIEIKIGQGTKPGMGGFLPGSKVSKEIAKIRNKEAYNDIISPSRFRDVKTKDDLRNLVEKLREDSEGRPIGIKLAAGHIEDDLEWVAYSGADFVTIDGRGGGSGSSPKNLKDSTTIPTIYALYRAKRYIQENNIKLDLIITGGLRLTSDFAKAIALGADSIAIGSAALMATACQQYRMCNTGMCPVGVATQDKELRKRLDIEKSSKRLFNFLEVTKKELKMFGRITGNNDIHNLSVMDLTTTNKEISEFTNIKHV